jgi:hypothetical protein
MIALAPYFRRLFSPPYFRLSRFAIIFAFADISPDISRFHFDCRRYFSFAISAISELPPLPPPLIATPFLFRYAAERRIAFSNVICFISARHSMIQHHHHRHVDHRLIA